MNKQFLEALFWLHILVIVLGVLMGLIFPLPLVLGIVFVHRLQFLLFKDCLLSKAQKKLQGLPEKKPFLQFAVHKIFNWKISDRQSHNLDYLLVALTVAIAVISHLLRLYN